MTPDEVLRRAAQRAWVATVETVDEFNHRHPRWCPRRVARIICDYRDYHIYGVPRSMARIAQFDNTAASTNVKTTVRFGHRKTP